MSKLTIIAFTAVLVAGCGDAAPTEDPRDAHIAQLTQAVEELAASNEALGKEVRRQGRLLDGTARVSPIRGHSQAGAVSAQEPQVETDGTGARDTSAGATPTSGSDDEVITESAMDALLETETGQKAIAKATAAEIERREAKDRRLFVSYQVGRFARSAGLDSEQTRKLQGIWKTSMDGGVELRKQFAAIGKLPEAARETARTEAMQSMRELGRVRRDSVGEVLNEEQLGLYEAAEEEIVSGLHGGSRR
jgi:hypothetical protein